MQKFINFNLDTTIDNPITVEKAIFKGDTINLTVKIFNNGVLADLTNENVDIILKKSDGTLLEEKQKTTSNGTVSAILGQQSTLEEGIVAGTILVSDANGHLSTNTFNYLVLPSIADDVFEASKNQIETLGDLLQAINANNAVLNNYTTLINQVAGTTDSVQALAKIESDINTYLPALQTANSEAKTNITNETAQNTQATQNITDLTAKNSEASNNITALGSKNTEAESNISALDTKNSTASQNITALGSKNTEAESNITALGSKNTEAESNITNLGTANTKAEANIAALNSFGDVGTLPQDVTAIKTEVENARGGKSSLSERLGGIDTSLSEITQNYNVYASSKSGNFYTVVDFKRADGTLYCESTLSNADSNGYFQTCTVKYYGTDGTAVLKTYTWTLTYDTDGKIISKVVA